MYRWLVNEHMSTRGIARRLNEQGIGTPRGANQWQPTAVHRILRNTAYKGILHYQRFKSVMPSGRLTDDPHRRARKTGKKARPKKDWIAIAVPSIVDEPTWEAAQAQLHQNSIHSSRNITRHEYLLRGLVRCPRCGGACCGYTLGKSSSYRCMRAHHANSSTARQSTP